MRYLILSTIFLLSFEGYGQVDKFATWKIMEGVSYEKSSDEYGEIYVPVFDEKIKALEGKTVTLPGYIIPFEGMFKPEKLIVSSLPIASCFFCGSGGPETVAEVLMKEPAKYTTKMVEITGVLQLNNSDTDQLMYILTDAVLN
ncbi:MAG: hypothetical protein ACJAZM_003383 [Cyclobacteriaceae bacterium]|jgi:hypothetical protein